MALLAVYVDHVGGWHDRPVLQMAVLATIIFDLIVHPPTRFEADTSRLAPGTALLAPVSVFPRSRDGVTRVTSCHVWTIGGVLRA